MRAFICFLAISVISLTSGCVNRSQLAEKEGNNAATYFSATTNAELLEAGLTVANEYLSLSDSVATQQDGLTVFNILLAAGAAAGVVNGMSADSLARIGIGGLAINQTSSYFDPTTTRNALTTAAKRQYCIVNAGKTYAPEDEVARAEIREAFLNVRFQLREDLNRNPEYYADLFKQYQERGAVNERAPLDHRTMESLHAEILKCLATQE
ncbi:hypothetical protein [Ruegeria sp. PrR005]|uniref:Lipoprotein n=1 Tax=Ruegeria sp. PrR005 TaxID=2706882 RepID=A0A6B2NUY4_9RHOB|nr:hypothetical protein [Ruegeria sp. PrR005]NDW47972.1 hypothetical protein [Ruegeria sp. PrR005]